MYSGTSNGSHILGEVGSGSGFDSITLQLLDSKTVISTCFVSSKDAGFREQIDFIKLQK